jgi:hypothetical protein
MSIHVNELRIPLSPNQMKPDRKKRRKTRTVLLQNKTEAKSRKKSSCERWTKAGFHNSGGWKVKKRMY